MSDQPGVVHSISPLPPVPAGPIASAIKRATFDALRDLPPDTNGAIVRLEHDRGAELAIAHRSADGRWAVKAWVGKSFEKGSPTEWGGQAIVTW